jgi:cytochrome c556
MSGCKFVSNFNQEKQMKKKVILASFGLMLGLGYGAAAFAQQKPDVLVKQRQAAMTLQGKYFGPLAGMASGKVPYNAEVAARNAGYLDVLNKMPWDGFGANTKDIQSRSLPEVFSEPGKFKEAADSMQAAVNQLVAATKGGGEAAVKAAINDVNKSCGGCHDNFRAKQ